jgi:hypothetical protein
MGEDNIDINVSPAIVTRDLVHEIDETTSDPWANAHERLCQSKAVCTCNKIVDIGRRQTARRLERPIGSAFEKI